MTSHQFAITNGEVEMTAFRLTMANELRKVADAVEHDSKKYVAIIFATCDQDGEGGPFVMIDSDSATVELVDEIADTLRNAMIEALE